MINPYIINILVFFAGTAAGSFFFTLAERYIDGSMKENPLKALFSRSKCRCGRSIPAVNLIPLFGYVITFGRCSSCGERIPLVYPLIEILYGCLALMFFHFQGRDMLSLSLYLVAALSVAIAIVDIRTMTIPVSLVGLFLLFSVYPVLMHDDFRNSLYGLLFLTSFFLIIMFIFPGSFGGGDIKLYAAAGLLLGFEMSIVLLEVSLITGALFGIFYGAMRGWSFRLKIPFAPFIAAGIILTILFGNTIILFYYRNLYSF